jgi:hypothetical protein
MFARFFSSKGGLGITDCEATVLPAYFGSIALAAPDIHAHITTVFPTTNIDMAHFLQLNALQLGFLAQLEPIERPKFIASLPIYNPSRSRSGYQKQLGSLVSSSNNFKINAALHRLYLDNALLTKTRYQRYISQCSRAGAAWMFAPPSGGNILTDQQCRDAIVMRIGSPPFLPVSCAICRKNIPLLDSEQHAFGTCAKRVQNQCGKELEYASMRALNLVGAKAHTPQPVYMISPGFLPTQWKLADSPNKIDYGDFVLNNRGIIQLIDVTYTNNLNSAKVHAATPCYLHRQRCRKGQVGRDHPEVHLPARCGHWLRD